MKEELQQEPQVDKKSFTLESMFDALYLVVLAGVIIYGGYVAINWDSYMTDDLILRSYFFVPIAVFSIVGIITIRSTKSLIYALSSVVVTVLLMVFFYIEIWPMLIG